MKIIWKVKDPKDVRDVVEFIFFNIRYHRNMGIYHRKWINFFRKQGGDKAKEGELHHIKRFDHHSSILMKWQAVLPKYTAKL